MSDRWLESLQKFPAPTRQQAAPGLSVPLEFADLCEVDTGEVGGLDDFGKALHAPEDSVGVFLEKANLAVLLKSSGVDDERWDAPLTPAVPIAKRGTPVTFTKGTMGHHLGIVSHEQKEIDGEMWACGYDAAGELVDMRLVRS